MSDFPDVYDDVVENIRTNYVGFAAFTILIWDHVDTFTTEVEHIWKGKKGILVYLFLLNRYLTPLGFIVNLFAYLSPTWTVERYEINLRILVRSINRGVGLFRCRHFVRYEGSMTVIGIHVVGLMMLIRIQALYSGQPIVVAGVFVLFLIMLSINAWLLSRGQPVTHNRMSDVKACTMIFPPDISVIASSSAWLPLLYDSTVLILTLIKTVPMAVGERRLRHGRNGANIMKRLFQDGLLYYSAIFSVNAVLTIMIVSAPEGLKNIAAQFELLITVTMMSRITLNLKKCAAKRLMGTTLADSGRAVIFKSGPSTGSGPGGRRNTLRGGEGIIVTTTIEMDTLSPPSVRPVDRDW